MLLAHDKVRLPTCLNFDSATSPVPEGLSCDCQNLSLYLPDHVGCRFPTGVHHVCLRVFGFIRLPGLDCREKIRVMSKLIASHCNHQTSSLCGSHKQHKLQRVSLVAQILSVNLGHEISPKTELELIKELHFKPSIVGISFNCPFRGASVLWRHLLV